MAVTLNTSSGFVTTAPTADPNGGSTAIIDGASVVTKDTSPSGAFKITQIGWYRASGTNTANFEVALYADSSGAAGSRLAVDNTNSSSSAGWITVAVDWAINPGTPYWLAVQMDAHSGSSYIDIETSGGSGYDRMTSQTTLNDPYGGGAVADADGQAAIYALVLVSTTTINSVKANIKQTVTNINSVKAEIRPPVTNVVSTKANLVSARYWVGNGGNWDDTGHWATSSGGTPGASLPSSTLDAIFDQNSFSSTEQTVYMNTAGSCLSVRWTYVTNSPTWSFNNNFTASGSIVLSPNMSVTYAGYQSSMNYSGGGTVLFYGAGLYWPINFNISLGSTSTLKFIGDFNFIKTGINFIYFNSGTWDTNGYNVDCNAISSTGSSTRVLNMNGSTFSLSGKWEFNGATNCTINPGTSTIVMQTGGYGNGEFKGNNFTYNNLTVSTVNTTVTDANTFNTVTIEAGRTLTLPASTTTTIGSLVSNGTSGSNAYLYSSSSGTQATISDSAGTNNVSYLRIRDSNATGGATFVADTTCTNVSNNTGWQWSYAKANYVKAWLGDIIGNFVKANLVESVLGEYFYGADNVCTLYGGTGTYEKYAQIWHPQRDKVVTLSLYIYKSGTPTDDVTVKITSTRDGSALYSASRSASSFTSGSWVSFSFGETALTPNGDYYIEVERSGARDTSNYYTLMASPYLPFKLNYRNSGTYSQFSVSAWGYYNYSLNLQIYYKYILPDYDVNKFNLIKGYILQTPLYSKDSSIANGNDGYEFTDTDYTNVSSVNGVYVDSYDSPFGSSFIKFRFGLDAVSSVSFYWTGKGNGSITGTLYVYNTSTTNWDTVDSYSLTETRAAYITRLASNANYFQSRGGKNWIFFALAVGIYAMSRTDYVRLDAEMTYENHAVGNIYKPIDILHDDFDDNSFDTSKWSKTSNITETNQRIECTNFGTENEFYVPNNQSYSLYNSYVLTRSYVDFTDADGSVYFDQVYQNDSNSVTYGFRVYNTGAGVKICVIHDDSNYAVTTYNSTTHKWLRMRDSGGTIYYEYSSDGENFSTLYSASDTGLDLMGGRWRVLFFPEDTDGSATRSMWLDNFNVYELSRINYVKANLAAPASTTKQNSARGHIKGLLGYWKLDEGSGTDIADEVGPNRTPMYMWSSGDGLTWQNSDKPVLPGHVTNDFYLQNDATADALITDYEYIPADLRAFTVQFRFKPFATNDNFGVIGHGYEDSFPNLDKGWFIRFNGSGFWFLASETGLHSSHYGIGGSYLPELNIWHDVAVTWEGGTTHQCKIWIDGNLVTNDTTTATGDYVPNTVESGFYIGAEYWLGLLRRYINAAIAEVKIWNYVRSDAEIITQAGPNYFKWNFAKANIQTTTSKVSYGKSNIKQAGQSVNSVKGNVKVSDITKVNTVKANIPAIKTNTVKANIIVKNGPYYEINLVPDPSFENASSLWTNVYNSGGSGSRVNYWASEGSNQWIIQASGYNWYEWILRADGLVLKAGKSYRISATVLTDWAGDFNRVFRFQEIGGAGMWTVDYNIPISYTYYRIYTDFTPSVDCYLYFNPLPQTWGTQAMWYDGVLVEEGSNSEYFDGDYANAYWLGTQDASPSAKIGNRNWAKANIILSTTKVNYSKSNIRQAGQSVNSVKANILITGNTKVNTTKASIRVTNTNLNTVRANIRTTYTNINYIKTDIKSTYTKVVYSKSNIKQAGTSVNNVKANILFAGITKIVYVKANLLPTIQVVNSVKANIRVNNNTVVNFAKGYVQIQTQTQDNYSKANIIWVNIVNSQYSKANIKTSSSAVNFVKANILQTYTNINSSKVSIVTVGLTKVNTVKASIVASNTKVIFVKANILTGYTKINYVKGSILASGQSANSVKANILVINNEKTNYAKTNIIAVWSFANFFKANIQTSYSKVDYTKSNISSAGQQVNSVKANVLYVNNTKNCYSIAAIDWPVITSTFTIDSNLLWTKHMMAIAPNGTIYYTERLNEGIGERIYVRYSTNGGYDWQTLGEPVDDNAGYSVNHPTIAIDSTGKPHVVFEGYNATHSTHLAVFYSKWNGSGWDRETIEYDTSYHIDNAVIALDSNDVPHVVASGFSASYTQAKVYYSNRVGGTWSAWSLIAADQGDHMEDMADIVIDSNDTVHAVWWFDLSSPTNDEQIVYSYKTSSGSWQPSEIIFNESILDMFPWYPAITRDASNNIYVAVCSYPENGGDWYVDMYYLKKTSSGWSAPLTVYDGNATNGDVGTTVTLTTNGVDVWFFWSIYTNNNNSKIMYKRLAGGTTLDTDPTTFVVYKHQDPNAPQYIPYGTNRVGVAADKIRQPRRNFWMWFEVETVQVQSVKANILVSGNTQINISKANIIILETKLNYAKASINASGQQPNSSKGNILQTYTQINSVKGQIVWKQSQLNTIKGNILQTYTNINWVKASILQTRTNINSVKANILYVGYTAVNTVKANIKTSYASIQSVKANILQAYTHVNNVKANIPAKKTNSVIGNILTIYTKINYVRGFIFSTGSVINYSKADIQNIYTQINSAKGQVVYYQTSDCVSKANILQSSTASQYAKASIRTTVSGVCYSKANILRTVVQPRDSVAGLGYTTNLFAWFKADAQTYNDEDSVTTMVDSSGNGNNLTSAGTAPKFKTNILNGQPVIRFSNNGRLTRTASVTGQPTGNNDLTMIIVMTPSAQNFNDTPINIGTDGSGNAVHFIYRSSVDAKWHFDVWGSTAECAFGTVDVGETKILTGVKSGSNRYTYTNGIYNNTHSRATNLGANSIQVGDLTANGLFFSGDIAEVLMYSEALSDANRRIVEAYLSAKYLGTADGYASKANILKANNVNVNTVKANIKASVSSVCTTKANIRNTYTDIVSVKANILSLYSNVQYAKGYILSINAINCYSKANIKTEYTKVAYSRGFIFSTGYEVNNVKANIRNAYSSICYAKASIYTTVSSVCSSKANIRSTISVINYAKASIVVRESRINTVKANIKREITNIITVKANIKQSASRVCSVKANILKQNNTNSNSVKANLRRSYSSVNDVKASIKTTGTAINYAKAYIFSANINWVNTTKGNVLKINNTQVNYSRANISGAFNYVNTVRGNIIVINTKPAFAKGNILQTYTDNNSSKASIVRTESYINVSRGDILRSYIFDQSTKGHIKPTRINYAKADILATNSLNNFVKTSIVTQAISYVNYAKAHLKKRGKIYRGRPYETKETPFYDYKVGIYTPKKSELV